MDFLTRFGLEKTRFTVLMMLAILALGLMSYMGIPKRENPEITIRTAAVAVAFDGMSPLRLEELIAIPIERRIREIGEVEDIETIITTGQVLIYVDLFDTIYGADIDSAWEDLRNKMQAVRVELPEGTSEPRVNTEYGDVSIATVALTGDGYSMAEMEDVAEDLRTTLFRVDGVTKVSLYGVQEERVWLEVDIRKLAAVGIQLQQLLDDLQAQNVILPAGEIDADGTKIVLEANGDLRSIEDIGGVLTQVSGLAGFVRLSDLIDVRRGYVDPKEKPVFYNGEPAIVAAVEMSADTDIQDLGDRLQVAMTDFENNQPIGIALNVSTFQETVVTDAVNNALENVGQTFIVVFFVMLLFLGFRSAIVIACIVPFTICFALAVMGFIGVDIEQVSIAAVIISLGLLVDNGLVVVEDIGNRIDQGMDPVAAAKSAGAQFVVPLGVASITTVSAFLPMLLMNGVEGEFAYSLGAVVSSMLLGSWLTALYILPYLCTKLLRRSPKAGAGPGHLKRAYGALVRWLLPFGLPLVALAMGAVVWSGSQFALLKSEMFPFSERSDFLIYMDLPKEAAISETERMALRVQHWLNNSEINPDVVNTTVFVGDGGPRFNLGLNPADPDPTSAFFHVNVIGLDASEKMAARARRVFVEQFPEARFRVTRLPQGGSESGIVDVEIFGPDLDVLMSAASEIELAFSELPHVVKNENDWGNKVIKVVVDIAQDKAREFGVTSRDISEVMEAYFSGTTYSTFREGDEQIPIVLRASAGGRDSLEDLADLTVSTGGQLISVDQVASFRPVLEFSEIRRENQLRRIVVSGKSAKLSAQQTLERLQPVLDGLDLGPKYEITISGELEDSADVMAQMGENMPLALGVMLGALIFQFNSLRRSLATFLTIPLIVIGAPFAMLLGGQPLSFFAMLGLMSLMGIIINNAIVLINQIDIECAGAELGDAIVLAAQARAKPIMLTSLTTMFGLVPMALSGGALFEPMATMMIGGLAVASPLTLIVTPPLCYLLLRPRKHLKRSAQALPTKSTFYRR
ncbi:MAG: efflux RND transporter permease subunit [Pseudomonadota bacterium]